MDIMGDIMGEEDLEGLDDNVDGDELVGATLVRRPNTIRLPAKPAWRQSQVAPGVSAPAQMLQPLPLQPSTNNGIFTDTVRDIAFTAVPQRPFRAERLVADVGQSGTSGVQLRIVYMSVGVEVQQVALAAMPLKAFAPNAFGVRMKLSAAGPGITITVQVSATGTFGANEEIPAALMFLGRSIA